jgi:hypothetical protein
VDPKTLAASGFTAAVLAAAVVWTCHDRAWHRNQNALAKKWRARSSDQPSQPAHAADFVLVEAERGVVNTISRVTLSLDPDLRVERMRVGTGRWNDEREKGVVDYEADEYRQASAQFLPDGAFAVFVESADIGHSEWYEFVVPPGAVSGQVLAGKSQNFIDIGPSPYRQPQWVEGTLKLSGLPKQPGDRVMFDLRIEVSTGWAFHAQAEVEVKAAELR